MSELENKKTQDETDSTTDKERVRFGVTIFKDGSTFFTDIPREILSLLKGLFPLDKQVETAGEVTSRLDHQDPPAEPPDSSDDPVS